MPVAASVAPVMTALHAAAVVPRFQYRPPRIAAPAPLMKIALVICHHSAM